MNISATNVLWFGYVCNKTIVNAQHGSNDFSFNPKFHSTVGTAFTFNFEKRLYSTLVFIYSPALFYYILHCTVGI